MGDSFLVLWQAQRGRGRGGKVRLAAMLVTLNHASFVPENQMADFQLIKLYLL